MLHVAVLLAAVSFQPTAVQPPPLHASPSPKALRQQPSPSLVAAAASAVPPLPPSRPEVPLQATAFVFVLGLSLASLSPAPFMTEQLGQVKGMQLLTALATTSAFTEIIGSPIVGGLADSVGRKPVLLSTLASTVVASIAAALAPSVLTVSLAKFVSSAVVGIFFLAAGASLADSFRGQPKQLAAASGVLFALVNLGFGVGVALSGLLPPSLRMRYATSSLVCLASLLGASFGLRETLPRSEHVAFKARSFNPFAFTRLLAEGRTMRLLVSLSCLTLPPLFMGDTLQVVTCGSVRCVRNVRLRAFAFA